MRKLIVGKNLTECVEFPHSSPNELGGLGTEVQNDNFLLHILRVGWYRKKSNFNNGQMSISSLFPEILLRCLL